MRKRYRILNVGRLIRCLRQAPGDLGRFREWYTAALNARLADFAHAREPHWSGAFAVGSEAWLQGIQRHYDFQRKRILPVVGAEGAEGGASYYIQGRRQRA